MITPIVTDIVIEVVAGPAAESSAGGPADLTATLAALAQPSTAGSPGGGPDLTTTLRAAAAAEARSREGQAGEAALLDGDSDSLINA